MYWVTHASISSLKGSVLKGFEMISDCVIRELNFLTPDTSKSYDLKTDLGFVAETEQRCFTHNIDQCLSKKAFNNNYIYQCTFVSFILL